MEDKKVCIIYTGGTIGMVPTEDGFAPQKGFLNQALTNIHDLSAPGMASWDLVEFDPLLDSSNISFKEWNQIAETIRSLYDEYDGFVVLHGTDTMAYSTSALSFMLEGLNKPVVFTGSQIPLSMLRSDGYDNIITSVMIAAEGKVREVCLYFSNKLLRGNRATKYSADELIAFDSPNFPPLAEAGIDIHYKKAALARNEQDGEWKRLNVTPMQQFNIGVIKLFPGIRFELFSPIVRDDLDALILETFGTGNIPSTDKSLPPFIAKAIDHGTSVIVITQCPQGSVRLGAYEAGSALAKAGAISGYNMTTEAAVTKLTYLLSLGKTQEEIRTLMETDLRGELDKL